MARRGVAQAQVLKNARAGVGVGVGSPDRVGSWNGPREWPGLIARQGVQRRAVSDALQNRSRLWMRVVPGQDKREIQTSAWFNALGTLTPRADSELEIILRFKAGNNLIHLFYRFVHLISLSFF